MSIPDLSSEWLETDGWGAFASGTVGGYRTRRYHALLMKASEIGKIIYVNGFDAWVETRSGTFPISTQRYAPDSEFPDGHQFLTSFTIAPWPTWNFTSDNGITIQQEIFIRHQTHGVCLKWSVVGGDKDITLHVRPFLSGRGFHSLQQRNDALVFDASVDGPIVRWRPYTDLEPIVAGSNGEYSQDSKWYHQFLYETERDRGLDYLEDLASPGEFHWSLANGPAVLLLHVGHPIKEDDGVESDPTAVMAVAEVGERKRRVAIGNGRKEVQDYIVRRDGRKTIIAGYPWFSDWGRDTFIALRGLCIANTRWDEAREVLLSWAGTVSEGMLPNRFPDDGKTPEYNSVDASLWYIIAVSDYLEAASRDEVRVDQKDVARYREAVQAILEGYSAGTRFGIHLDDDGMLACGTPGVQLTWMDAKVGDWVVTPRIGKPVEIQALWLAALDFASTFSDRWDASRKHGQESFVKRFWNESGGYLHDVVDVDHRAGDVDDTFRPNQIFAVGGLPIMCLDRAKARAVVDAVEAKLLTPLGLRSLSEDHPAHRAMYSGGVRERDGAYHQGTVWPWLLGPFVEAWLRVRDSTPQARQEAHQRFLLPLEEHLEQAGIGHISEICDGEPPHTPRGCPFQAWSLGEYLRIKFILQADLVTGTPR